MKSIFNIEIFYVFFLFIAIVSCGDFVSEDKYRSDSKCGNGVIDPGEFCDSSAILCSEIDSEKYNGGFALCGVDCSDWDTSLCEKKEAVCGNEIIETGEVCDGDCILCSDISEEFTGGVACCFNDCSGYDTSRCVPFQECGNGVVEGPEICELGQAASCSFLDENLFHSGIARCDDSCMSWDTSSCVPKKCVHVSCGKVSVNYNDSPRLFDCGSCEEGLLCNEDNVCVDPCEEYECGSMKFVNSDGRTVYVECGKCGKMEYCDEEYSCKTACQNMNCGNDHGFNCGNCESDYYCSINDYTCREKPVHDMEIIPEGGFHMGCNDFSDKHCRNSSHPFEDEHPYHKVMLSEYYIDKFEVTLEKYEKCIDAGVCSNSGKPRHYNVHEYNYYCTIDSSAPGDFPVNCVNWYGAQTYCKWMGMHLPTEAEWEKAARGGCEFYENCREGTFIYPWGDEQPSCDLAIMKDPETEVEGCDTGYTFPVGSKPDGKSPYGLYDMAGNVWEWTYDWYDEDYFSYSSVQDPQGPESGSKKIIKGGSCTFSERVLRSSYRRGLQPAGFYTFSGFRCVYSP